jgi:UDP-N-acetylmuramoylalanine--D-glutamate ligase
MRDGFDDFAIGLNRIDGVQETTMTVRDNFRAKNILIAGMGKSGTAAFETLVQIGAMPAVYDDKDIEWEAPKLFAKLADLGTRMYFNGKPLPDNENWDVVIPSPGVPLDLPFLARAIKKGAKVIGELELSFQLGNGMYVAITGTNGKTTTTALAGEIFRNSGRETVVAGNIGIPVLPKAMKAREDTWLITEVSSFQLDTTIHFRPRISAFLNLTPDHLDRHKTMEDYRVAKAKIFANQGKGDFFIYNADDGVVVSLVEQCRAECVPFSRKRELEKGLFVREGMILVRDGGEETPLVAESELRIPGKHNLENALAAAAIAWFAGIDRDVICDSLRHFNGVEHRLELVATLCGVRFVNDSKGTNPDASIKALEAVGKKIILIAGGYDKHTDFKEFMNAATGRVRHMLLLGATAEQLRVAAEAVGFRDTQVVLGMGEAVRLGYELAEPGDTVLLSPACASWDMYGSFEERGAHFKEKVAELQDLEGNP